MKNIILAFILTFAIGKISAQTTEEEYNYVTKGYKVQLESGLDMKKGYEIKEVDYVKQAESNGNIAREGWLKSLNRVSTNGTKIITGYMIVYQRAGKPKEYLCIPNPNSSSEIRDAYFKSLYPDNSDNSARLQVISFLLSRSLKW